MKFFFLVLALSLVLLISVILYRTFTFPSRQIRSVPAEHPFRVREEAARNLAEAIRYQTISYDDPERMDTTEFARFHRFIQETYPRVHQQLERETVNEYSLLYRWPGTNADTANPVLLAAHMDVVPVEEASLAQWTREPFGGTIADGYIWGRGTLDDKVSMIGILEAVEKLLAEGFTPSRDVYLAFGHDEEIGGTAGAASIASRLRSRNIRLEVALDEGGPITQGIVPSMEGPVALIGTAEKGFMAIELTVSEDGGHSSMPRDESAVTILTRALVALQDNPFPARISGPVQDFARFIGPEFPFVQRMAFANLWLFRGMIIRQYQKTPSGAATVRTTMAPTILRSGVKENLIPTVARATINFRILPGETSAGVISHVKSIINDERIQLSVSEFLSEPSPVSSTHSAAFRAVQETIAELFPETLITPFLMVGATDGRYYAPIAENVYRFLPLRLNPEDLERIHGIDERIAVSNFEECIRYYFEIIRKLAG
jgi:carboxypeptidase PM20D1